MVNHKFNIKDSYFTLMINYQKVELKESLIHNYYEILRF